jgi:hypothetical protein
MDEVINVIVFHPGTSRVPAILTTPKDTPGGINHLFPGRWSHSFLLSDISPGHPSTAFLWVTSRPPPIFQTHARKMNSGKVESSTLLTLKVAGTAG